MEVTQDQFVQGLLYALGYVLGWFWPRRKWIGEPPGRAGGPGGFLSGRGGDRAAQSIVCDRRASSEKSTAVGIPLYPSRRAAVSGILIVCYYPEATTFGRWGPGHEQPGPAVGVLQAPVG